MVPGARRLRAPGGGALAAAARVTRRVAREARRGPAGDATLPAEAGRALPATARQAAADGIKVVISALQERKRRVYAGTN